MIKRTISVWIASLPLAAAALAQTGQGSVKLQTFQASGGGALPAADAQAEIAKTHRTSQYLTLAAAVAASDGSLLRIDNVNTITTDMTIPASEQVRGDRGGLLKVATGHTLTINGSFDCGNDQCIATSTSHPGYGGTVILNSTPKHNARWWGALGNLGSHNDATVTSGSNRLTTVGAWWSVNDVHKVSTLFAGGPDCGGGCTNYTITSYVNPNTVTLSGPSPVSTSKATFHYGTDDSDATQSTIDSIIAGALLNGIQGAPAGIAYYPAGTYYITKTITLCHYNGCPALGTYPAGVMNAGIDITGDNLGATSFYTAFPIDLFQMYSWSAGSTIENMSLISSGIPSAGVRIRGNTTFVHNLWLFANNGGILLEADRNAFGDSGTIIDGVLCDSPFNGGGPGACITFNRVSGVTDTGPRAVMISHVECFSEDVCISGNALYETTISDITCVLQGSNCILLQNAHDVVLSNINQRGMRGDATAMSSKDQSGVHIIGSDGVTIHNLIAKENNGPGLWVDSSTRVSVNGIVLKDNAFHTSTAAPSDIYVTNSEITVSGGSITNSNGHPASAIHAAGTGKTGSYAFDHLVISGGAYPGTVMDLSAGGFRRISITNNDLQDLNPAAGATPDISLGSVTGLAVVSGNLITHHGAAPSNWLEAADSLTNTCLSDNRSSGGSIRLGGATYGASVTGCIGRETGGLPGISGARASGVTASVPPANVQFSGGPLPAGLYLIGVYLTATPSGTATITPTVTWTDSRGNAGSQASAGIGPTSSPANSYGTILAEVDGKHDLAFSIALTGSATYDYRVVVLQRVQ